MTPGKADQGMPVTHPSALGPAPRKPWWAVLAQPTRAAPPPVLQVAADGSWETAEVISLGAGRAHALEVVERVARAARHDIAVEVLWPAHTFCGVRWATDQWDEAAAGTARAHDARTARTAAEAPSFALLFALLGGVPSPVVEVAELGAVNAWKSIGPELLWRHGDRHTQEAVDATLRRRPDLTACKHPLAVELAVTSPQPCWVGICVSRPCGTVHQLDRQALTAVLDNGGCS